MPKTYNIPERLIPTCNEPVKQSANGRWYIMRHSGFNSSTNNGRRYGFRAAAVKALRKYVGK